MASHRREISFIGNIPVIMTVLLIFLIMKIYICYLMYPMQMIQLLMQYVFLLREYTARVDV